MRNKENEESNIIVRTLHIQVRSKPPVCVRFLWPSISDSVVKKALNLTYVSAVKEGKKKQYK